MTILVLDLKAPDVAGRREYDAALLAALPQFYGFALSFGLLCLLWMAHHARLSALKRIDAGLLGWNCAMLFFAALTPLPTSMLFGRSYGSPVPPVFYALAMSCTWLCLNGMWRHAWRAGLMADDVSARTYRGALLSTLPHDSGLPDLRALRLHPRIRLLDPAAVGARSARQRRRRAAGGRRAGLADPGGGGGRRLRAVTGGRPRIDPVEAMLHIRLGVVAGPVPAPFRPDPPRPGPRARHLTVEYVT